MLFYEGRWKNMRLDFVSEEEKDQIKGLMKYCFLIDDDTLDWIGEEVFEAKNCLGVYEDERIVASLQVLPFEIFFNGNPVQMGGINAVCTLPEHRSKHYAGDLLERALKLMRERNQIFSMLAPFSYDFYRKYGWELAFQARKYEFNVRSFKKYKETENVRLEALDFDDIPEVKTVYENYIRKYNGALKRSEKDWNIKFKGHEKDDKYRYGCIDEDGVLQGYIFFKIKDRKINIDEFCYNSIKSKKSLFSFIYSHRSQVKKVQWKAPDDDNTILMLNEPDRSHKFEIGMMIRIVDVEEVLKRIEVKEKVSRVSFAMRVLDSYASWNDKIFNIRIENGELEIEILDNDIDADIVCPIQTLSQLISGYAKLEELYELGEIKGDADKVDYLSYLISDGTTFMNDHF